MSLFSIMDRPKSRPATQQPAHGTASLLQQFPAEVTYIVFDHLEREDLISFRLASNVCARFGAPALFRSLHVMFTLKSFQNIMEISRKEELSKQVREISYEPVFLPRISKEVYKARFRSFERQLDDHTLRVDNDIFRTETEKAAKVAWKAYQTIRDEQIYIRIANIDVITFANATRQFPLLETITISNNCGCPQKFSLPTQLAYKASRAVDHLHLISHVFGEDVGVRGANAILASLPPSGRIKDIQIVEVDWSFIVLPPPKTPNIYLPFFSRLTTIRLSFAPSRRELANRPGLPSPTLRHKEFAKLLKSATNLENLHLKVMKSQISKGHALECLAKYIPVYLHTIFEDCTWPKLHTLEICGITADERTLNSLLQRHASTLKSLRLCGIHLLSEELGAYRNILDCIQSHMNVTSLDLGGLWLVSMTVSSYPRAYNFDNGWTRTLCTAFENKEKVPYEDLKTEEVVS